MLQLANRTPFSSKPVVLHLLLKQNKSQMLHPMSYSVNCKRVEAEDPQNINYRRQLLRAIHVTKVNKDLESGLRALGSGVAATGVVGSGIGIGLIFGNYISAISRNPSAASLFTVPAFLGMSFCESLGLFAIIVSFVIQA